MFVFVLFKKFAVKIILGFIVINFLGLGEELVLFWLIVGIFLSCGYVMIYVLFFFF